YLNYAEIFLFLAFGTKLLLDARRMGNNANLEVLEEAEEVIEVEERKRQQSPTSWGIFLEGFLLTFVAEWGDRTQIATIALAASHNVLGVTIGAILGHTICALIAVLGGKLIAGRISERTVTIIGGLLFYLFAGVAMINSR
ncbi:MAG: transrane protein, partial [Cyanobacteriota bacterium]